MKFTVGEYVAFTVLQVIVAGLVCLLAYVCAFVIAVTIVYPVFTLLLLAELLGSAPVAEFASLFSSQLATYAEALFRFDRDVTLALFCWGMLFCFALHKKIKQEEAKEAQREAKLHQAKLNQEADLYNNLLTSTAPWLNRSE